MQNRLFREQAVEHQKDGLHGDVLILQKKSDAKQRDKKTSQLGRLYLDSKEFPLCVFKRKRK